MIGVDKSNSDKINEINDKLRFFGNVEIKEEKDDIGEITGKDLLCWKLLKKELEENDISRILVCSSNHKNSKRLHKLVECMIEKEEIKAEIHLVPINCKSQEKDVAIYKIRSNKKVIIFQVRIFNLGVDVPELTTVLLNDPKTSSIDIIQTISRILRKHNEKEFARVLIPSVIGDNIFIEDGDYKNVRSILSNMALYDESIMEEIIGNCGKRRVSKESRRIRFCDIGENNTIDSEMMENIEIGFYDKLGERSVFSWIIHFENLLERIRKGLLINREIGNVGIWMDYQRMNYKKGNISDERKKLLEKNNLVNPDEWNTYIEKKRSKNDFDREWCENHKIIIKYLEENGKLPAARDIENKGKWFSHQKDYYKKGEMTDERKRLLEENKLVDIDNWNTSKEKKSKEDIDREWYKNAKIIIKYLEENGKLPKQKDIENKGNWFSCQKKYYKKGKMTDERKRLLEENKLVDINTWKTFDINKKKTKKDLNEEWYKNSEIVIKYLEENGKLPKQKDIENKGKWLSHQNTYYKKGKMTYERRKLLEDNSLVNPNDWKINK